MTDHHDADHPEYVPLAAAVIGHLTTSALLAPVVALITWLALRLAGEPVPGTKALAGALMACALGALAAAVAERPAVVAARHPAPGGWRYALWGLVLPPVAGGVVGWLESPRMALVLASVLGLVCGAEAVWTKPWQRGDGCRDVRDKWEATKDMTTELSLRDGWTDSARPKDGQ